MSTHEGAAAGERDRREDMGRFLSPRLRQLLAAVKPSAREALLQAGSQRLRQDGPEKLGDVVSELLEYFPGGFYPVYNADRERWELGIR